MLIKTLLLLAGCCTTFGAARDISSMGPGRGAWQEGAPEDFGMSSELLKKASAEVARLAPERYCLLIVKDGVIVHETYYRNTSETTYEADSLAKTITAAVVAVAIEKGLLDIDVPLVQYGVRPRGNWSVSGFDFFKELTMRHLLTQTAGYGIIKPGTRMTYDSDNIIQHISYAITDIVTGKMADPLQWYGALDFASREFASVLGIPDLYTYDELAPDFSAGGGQMVTCRDVARVGQLILNRGEWLDATNKPYQMARADFLDQMLQPAYPGKVDGYGFLTWLNTDVRTPTADGKRRSNCCAPRWVNDGDPPTCSASGQCGRCCIARKGYNLSHVPCNPDLGVIPDEGIGLGESCSLSPAPECAQYSDPSEYLATTNLGDAFPDVDRPSSFPGRIGIGMGQSAKYMYLVPERNLTVVTIGRSWGT